MWWLLPSTVFDMTNDLPSGEEGKGKREPCLQCGGRAGHRGRAGHLSSSARLLSLFSFSSFFLYTLFITLRQSIDASKAKPRLKALPVYPLRRLPTLQHLPLDDWHDDLPRLGRDLSGQFKDAQLGHAIVPQPPALHSNDR